MFKHATPLKTSTPPTLAELTDALESRIFTPCGPTQRLSFGWVPPRGLDHGAIVESVGGHYVAKLAIETRAVPAPVVKEATKRKADAAERVTGRRPRGKALRELKDEATLELLPRAFPKQRTVQVWIDPAAGRIVLDSSSTSAIDIALTALQDAIDGPMTFVQTNINPANMMTAWLCDGEPGSPEFSFCSIAKLKAADNSQAAIAFEHKDIDSDEAKRRVREGMRAQSMRLNWRGRVDFTLTAAGVALAGLRFGPETKPDAKEGEDAFDANAAILTGELSALFGDLIEALGGEAPQEQQPAA